MHRETRTHTSTGSVVLVVSVPRVSVRIPSNRRCSVGIIDPASALLVGITFVSTDADSEVLQKIQERFTVAIPEL
jgi:hypothetical protein